LNRVPDEARHNVGRSAHLSRVLLERSFVMRGHLRIGLIVVATPLIDPAGDILNTDQAEDIAAHGRHEIVDSDKNRAVQRSEAWSHVVDDEIVLWLELAEELSIPVG